MGMGGGGEGGGWGLSLGLGSEGSQDQKQACGHDISKSTCRCIKSVCNQQTMNAIKHRFSCWACKSNEAGHGGHSYMSGVI